MSAILRALASPHFPVDLRFGIGSGSEISPDILRITRMKDFDPLAFQIHEFDMEREAAPMLSMADAVLTRELLQQELLAGTAALGLAQIRSQKPQESCAENLNDYPKFPWILIPSDIVARVLRYEAHSRTLDADSFNMA